MREEKSEAFPTTKREVALWLRNANSQDVAEWLRSHPTAIALLGSNLSQLGAKFVWLYPSPSPTKVVVAAICEARDHSRNIWGFLHGGVLCGLIDEISSIAACLAVPAHRVGPTLSLQVSFARPAAQSRFVMISSVQDLSNRNVAIKTDVLSVRTHAKTTTGTVEFALRRLSR